MEILKEHFNPDDYTTCQKVDIDCKVEIPLPILMELLNPQRPKVNKLITDIEYLHGVIETLEMEIETLNEEIEDLENELGEVE